MSEDNSQDFFTEGCHTETRFESKSVTGPYELKGKSNR